MIDVNKYDAQDFIAMFDMALKIVYYMGDRPWHNALRHKYLQVHPAIYDAMKLMRPTNWQQLLLEYPHRAESDPYRIAYTRDERAGEQDRQTVTTIGKYLMRHFDLPDHRIRDIVALHTSPSEFKILDTVNDFVHAVNNGPGSCMCWSNREFVRCSDGVRRHPYETYDPKFGWRMAIRTDGGQINGRALLQVSDEDARYFVRSFKRAEGGGYSHSDEQLEAWLKEQGYRHYSGWDGALLAYIPTNEAFLAPYIDGEDQSVDVTTRNGERVLCITSSGDYECDNTDGTPSGGSRCTCDCCGDTFHEDDMCWVDRNEETHVCEECRDNEYTWAYTRRGYEAYIYSQDVVFVGSTDSYYDENFLSDNNIVELADGGYEHTDSAVYVNSSDAWYHGEDERVVYTHECEHELLDDCVQLANGEWALEDQTFCCDGDGKYYLSDDVEPVIVDGGVYHPDNVPETEESTTETGE